MNCKKGYRPALVVFHQAKCRALCEDMRHLSKNESSIFVCYVVQSSGAGLFEVFSIDFAGLFPMPYIGGPGYLIVFVVHLTSWPTVRATLDKTADTVLGFMQEEVLHSCGPPRIKVSDNASCFTA